MIPVRDKAAQQSQQSSVPVNFMHHSYRMERRSTATGCDSRTMSQAHQVRGAARRNIALCTATNRAPEAQTRYEVSGTRYLVPGMQYAGVPYDVNFE